MMTVEDAMKWCDSKLSQGTMFGGQWMYWWTRVSTFFRVFPEKGLYLDISKLTDNGSFDKKIASLGLRKYSLHEFRSVLGPLGVTVIDAGGRKAA